MSQISLGIRQGKDLLVLSADLLVIPVFEGDGAAATVKRLDAQTGGTLKRRVRAADFRGQEGRCVLCSGGPDARFRSVLLVGMGGSTKAPELDLWRRAGAEAVAAARSESAEGVVAWVGRAGGEEAIALAEGTVLSTYSFRKYRKAEKTSPSVKKLTVVGRSLGTAAVRARLRELESVTAAVSAARDLVNEPPSVKTPAFLGRKAIELCKGTSVRVEVMGPAKIRAMKLNGLIAVNRGSQEPARFIRMYYKPRGKSQGKIAIVGKGITFDSGGLSLKPPASMETMKQDMAGAAAVIATMAAVGRVRPRVEVTGYVPSTDNLPSGSAQKPGDIIRYRNGKSVEVLNTDAEGRLVLADALVLACDEKNDVIIDLATLTGACRIALGARVAAIMGNDESLVNELVEHGKAAGEPIWPLPLVREYRDELRSNVADLKNIGGRLGGAITAGLFLQEFVDGAKWAHLDIAGPAYADRDWPGCPKGGTGFGVRTLVRYLQSL